VIELIDTFIRPLIATGLPYAVTGSVASMAYGEPRLTNDIDLVLACGLISVVLVLLTQLISDIGYAFLNPRIRVS
jgi:ABC-type microcin C transport system permease subunit YejB